MASYKVVQKVSHCVRRYRIAISKIHQISVQKKHYNTMSWH